jgi:hypothetical protein
VKRERGSLLKFIERNKERKKERRKGKEELQKKK